MKILLAALGSAGDVHPEGIDPAEALDGPDRRPGARPAPRRSVLRRCVPGTGPPR